MTAILLPTTPGPSGAVVHFLDWGSDQTPSLGGPAQRLDRAGSRHAVDFTLPPMAYVDAMVWCQRLKRGKKERVIMPFPQPGLVIGSPGSPLVSGAVAGGTSLSLDGMTSGYQVREGQYLSIIHSVRRYLYSADALAAASGAGTLVLAISPMLRTALSDNDVVEIASPKIEGMLSGDETSWNIDTAFHVGLQFTVIEAA